ncbi:U3 small nucleolar RNA-associated protein 4 [Pseudocercospora fuligena]|uniref:U3 small nucleolar RNA-associated protein 4 n=1 Tax=Pseudocercospora fuligena TaxID=685502 RepID=A0A8H6VKF1_9PEZI|nr:U3 small nucleolar RNA-associated protein 4 [Pseudocercospora fuligena]
MDVHRSRFVPFPVHAITAVAFSRGTEEAKLPDGVPQPTLRLAIGRDNGQIEIWNQFAGRWVQERIFTGDKSVDGLAWTREPDEVDFEGQPILGQYRLFSIASSPHVLEWDLKRGGLKKRSTGNFSEVWCFAVQPRLPRDGKTEPKSQDLVAGCGDGTIALLSTADDDLQFQRFLARVSGKRAKCISITYQNRDRIVAGFADSNIRVIDTRNGNIIRTMSLGNGVPPAPRNKFVWKVRCLRNGDIVSGDSDGDVVFWDGRSYSLNQKIKGHDSDCVDIVTGSDGKTVITGSLDGRVAVHQNITNANGRKTWVKTHHRRVHAKSEVKAMAAYDGKDLSVVVSGGSDFAPTVIPIRDYGKADPKSLSHLPQAQSPIVSARRARLLASWWDNSISIWRIARPHDVEFGPEPQPPRKLVGKLVLKSKQSISSVAISDDGKILVATTDAELKLFQLRRSPGSHTMDFKPMTLPSAVATAGARLVCFSPDGKWLAIVNPDNEVHVLRLAQDPAKPKRITVVNTDVELERQHRTPRAQSAYKGYEEAITRLAFSHDSCILVASDISGHLDSWVLEGHEDLTAPQIDVTRDDSKQDNSDDSSSDSSDDEDDQIFLFHGQHWTDNPAAHLLPKLDSAALVLTFRPSTSTSSSGAINGNPGVHPTRHNPHAHSHQLPQGPHRLWVMTTKHQMYEFDVLEGRLSDWSRRNPTSSLPEDFKKLKDHVLGAVWDVSDHRERLWLYGSYWLFMLNVKGDIVQSTKKRRHSSSANGIRSKALKRSGSNGQRSQWNRDGLPSRALRSENGVSMDIDLDAQPQVGDMDLDDPESDGDELRLARIKGTDEEENVNNVDSQAVQERKWWCTYKYRSILGMVPLEDEQPSSNEQVEVVIVERPLWDVQEAMKGSK